MIYGSWGREDSLLTSVGDMGVLGKEGWGMEMMKAYLRTWSERLYEEMENAFKKESVGLCMFGHQGIFQLQRQRKKKEVQEHA